jgi:phosphoribosylformylglycinamidine synthase
MVGLVHDLSQVRGLAWREAGDLIWLLGAPLETGAAAVGADGTAAAGPDPRVGLAGSSYLERLHGQVTGRPPEIDLALEKTVQAFLRQAIADGLVASAHDLSDGGLAVAAAEASIASGLGAHLELPAGAVRFDRLLFAEGGARILVSVPPAQTAAWQQALDQAAAAGRPVPAQCLGVVEADPELSITQAGTSLLREDLEPLRQAFEQAIPRRIGAAVPPTH